ncbi:hypothetical protein QBC47DRAFT_127320 [Echria macrotheca]|uniref:Uncharacterized protein n=1 Tax=Echria macrotheca TaxID=438768 RepID=A0AAJ0B1K4_9PEZI|nr:hypothetical protein QBC47DRAFT_127320 [Echria macrotheca]
MVCYCAYCGKSFTRKEHLERHLPSHTNVKPYLCDSCHLGFARRDLLQRHYSTYHEPRDHMNPLPGGMPTVAGRTPIACQNCASAKTGCDKRVPCGRCSEKNLPCAARYARRSSKNAAARLATATAATTQPVPLQPFAQSPSQLPLPPIPQTVNPSFVETNPGLVAKAEASRSPPNMEAVITVDNQMNRSAKKEGSEHSHLSPAAFASPLPHGDRMDEFAQMSEYMNTDLTYTDATMWQNDYGVNFDLYGTSLPLEPGFGDFSDTPISAESEAMTRASTRGSMHTRGTSVMSQSDFDIGNKTNDVAGMVGTDSAIPEFQVMMEAEGAWNLARCNKPLATGSCPRTAILHLECLEKKSKLEGTWDSLERYMASADWDDSGLASVVPLTSRTRDKLLVMTQNFLRKALDVHLGSNNGYPKAGYALPGDFNMLVLPPSHILEHLLRSYVRTISVYYPLVAAGQIDPNEMLDNQASALLLLLMIAQGAAAMPIAEARYLSAGLTEMCRISLTDMIERDIELSVDPTVIRCALLFTVLGAWSGDKWLMDITMGQRGHYMEMLQNAGMLEPQSTMIPTFNASADAELQWHAWQHRESQNRLVYNWVMLDLELSLFHDKAPVFAITDLQCPLPGSEMLWTARNAERWVAAVQSVYGCTDLNPQLLNTPSLTPSLFDLFQDFLYEGPSRREGMLTPQQMRLLLHPLQSMVSQLRNLLSCFHDSRRSSGSATKNSTLQQLVEVDALLTKWYKLTFQYLSAHPDCAVTRCNLVLYHLISLNSVTNFTQVERLARREGFDGCYLDLSLRHNRCIFEREQAIYHCGQVSRLLRLMPKDKRPAWWSVAMYRAMLILWAESVSRQDPNFQLSDANRESPHGAGANAAGAPRLVAVDRVPLEDPAMYGYMWQNTGVAVLTRPGDGALVSLDRPTDVLAYATSNLQDGHSSRLSDGIIRKLVKLGENWNVEAMGTVPTTCGP